MNPVDANVAESPAAAQRDVVLRDLVALRQVRIEVVLSVELRALGDVAPQRQTDHQPVVDGLGVDDRQAPRQTEAARTGVDVRLVAERQLAAAEHLRAGLELDVDLEPDDGLVLDGAHEVTRLAGLPSKSIARSSANAASSIAPSPNAGAASWKPTGQSVGQAAGDRDRRDAGQRHRDRVEIVQVHRQGIIDLGAELEGRHRAGRSDDEVELGEDRAEVLGDPGADLQGGPVVGVVVAARQRIGTEHDPPLDLGTEAGCARPAVHRRQVSLPVDPQPVADAVEPRQVGRRLGRGDQVVGRQPVLGVRKPARVARSRRAAPPTPASRRSARRTPGSTPLSIPSRSSGTPSRMPARSWRVGSAISPGYSSDVESNLSRPIIRLNKQRRVGHVPRERSGLIERRRERDHPEARARAVGRLQADDPA